MAISARSPHGSRAWTGRRFPRRRPRMGGRCQRCGSPGSPAGSPASCEACQLSPRLPAAGAPVTAPAPAVDLAESFAAEDGPPTPQWRVIERITTADVLARAGDEGKPGRVPGDRRFPSEDCSAKRTREPPASAACAAPDICLTCELLRCAGGQSQDTMTDHVPLPAQSVFIGSGVAGSAQSFTGIRERQAARAAAPGRRDCAAPGRGPGPDWTGPTGRRALLRGLPWCRTPQKWT